jgi:hypothetical protein
VIILRKIKNTKYLNFLTTKKLIESRLLNLLGIQIFRYILAKLTYKISGIFYKKILNDYEDKGYFFQENFLSPEEFLKINVEFSKIIEKENLSRNIYGKHEEINNSSIDYILFEFEDIKKNQFQYPALYNLYKNKKIHDFFSTAEKKNEVIIFMRLERVYTKDQLQNDANSHWHVDTYHNTNKAWIYLTDVNLNNGPFNYIEGSNKFSLNRLIWEYLNSIETIFNKKITPFFVKKNKSQILEKKKIEFTCKKNSFLIANTHGFHRRGDALNGKIRDTISFYTRENPYKLF